MNYYNPYFSSMPYTSIPARTGLFSSLLGGKTLNFGSILSGTQRVIGFANQAIPLAKQISPAFKNAKTMFKVMNEFKKVNVPDKADYSTNVKVRKDSTVEHPTKKTDSDEGPIFFI